MRVMISRRSRTRVAQLALGVMLFAQVALATAACDWLQAAPARAIAANSSEQPCHEEPTNNANLCLAHCLSADQSADTPQVVFPAWIDTVPLTVAVRDRWSGPVQIVQFVLSRPAAPPPRILFQSFQI
jgi:hypothetical protein